MLGHNYCVSGFALKKHLGQGVSFALPTVETSIANTQVFSHE